MVTRLDRLARSTRDLLNTLGTIADRKAGFRSLSDAWADTTSAHGRLMLTVLGGLAEFERELIRTPDRRRTRPRQGPRGEDGPTAEDDAAPDQGGTHRRDAGEPMRDIARSYNVSHSTISRLVT
jgi:DNA invertase Pin-like site-specific DNA recombinase